MDIFRRKQTPAEVNVPRREVGSLGWNYGVKKYSDIYFWLLVHKVFGGLANVCYELSEEAGAFGRNLVDTMNNELNVAIWEWWDNGFMVIERAGESVRLVPGEEVKRHMRCGRLEEPTDGRLWVIIYSDTYLFTGHSDFDVIRENLCLIDRMKSADDYLTSTFGALGLLSGKEMPLGAADKEDFINDIKRNAGVNRDKFQLIISNAPVDFRQINFPLSELNLAGKVKDELMLLADYFRVPFDLLNVSGASTYANQEQAVKNFYSECISPLAEHLLACGRRLIRRDKSMMIPSDALTFHIDNVPELEDDRKAGLDYLHRLAEVAKMVSEMGGDTSNYMTELIRYGEER